MDHLQALVYILTTMCLVHGKVKKNESVFTAYYHKLNYNILVRQNGDIVGNYGTPTIFHLFKETVHYDRVNQTTNQRTVKFTLEAIASGKLICMTHKGQFYTMDSEKILEKQRERRRRRNSKKKIMPPKNCLLSSLEFSVNQTYHRSLGIYSSAHSNDTIGRFISFTENGAIRSYRKAFSEPETNVRIKISLNPANKYLHEIIQMTTFRKSNNFNQKVRRCINKHWTIFQSRRVKHGIRHGKKANLHKVLKKCVDRVKAKFDVPKFNATIPRKKLDSPQDSKSLIEKNPKFSIPRQTIE